MTTPNTTTTGSSTNTNGNGTTANASKERAAPSAIMAITRIGKILDQLSPADRKRVLAFVNESNT